MEMSARPLGLLSVLSLCAWLSAQDVILDWNGTALSAIRAGNTPPPAASRNLAILHAAIFDAVNGVAPRFQHYLVAPAAAAGADAVAAASQAAHDVLVARYPTQAAAFDAQNATELATVPDGQAKTDGIAWGQSVASQILAARANDGSTVVVTYPGSTQPGAWRPTISFGGIVRPALLPGWGQVTPFVLLAGDQFRPPAPPALTSRQYAFDVLFTQYFGGATHSLRTAEQTEMAQFWGYGPNTATPPGHWNQITTAVVQDHHLALRDEARLFALVNFALADAAIASWDCKYVFGYWRPITAIQLADTDGNPWTTPDPNWAPLLPTPPFPEYTSGHSTFSGAAATVLVRFFGRDHVAFSVGSDDLPGVHRSFRSFSAAAWESGISRLFGGIHFWSANIHGLSTGQDIGEYAWNHALRPLRHPH